MKEDILEQIVDDYLKFSGYFTRHNIPFKPRTDHPEYIADADRVPSDVDVVGVQPNKPPGESVIVVTCKSWQKGFNPRKKLTQLREDGGPKKKPTWHHFRELWKPKWSEAFLDEIERLTGQRKFAYRIAVTKFQGEDPQRWANEWGQDPTIAANLPGCSIGFPSLEDMWSPLLRDLTLTPAPSQLGRLVQLLKAAGLTAPQPVAEPQGPMPGSDADIAADAEEEAED
jgi:hypothetical protein